MALERSVIGVAACGLLVLGGCQALTREEASTALEELSLSAQASALTGSSVEIATSFTIGQAAEDAAMEIRTFVESQLPCADVTLSGATLTIVYGANPGTCTYRGQTYAGTHAIAVMRNEASDVVVMHTWTDFRNQTLEVDGSAMVTWSAADQTRHVSHTLTWTRMSDGRTGTGSGERTQAALAGGLSEGFSEDGERTWTGESGTWTLMIEGIEMRWADPVPQAGSYILDTPFDKRLVVRFERSDATTIRATFTSGARSYDFDVRSTDG